jgi:hypothetical protein
MTGGAVLVSSWMQYKICRLQYYHFNKVTEAEQVKKYKNTTYCTPATFLKLEPSCIDTKKVLFQKL